jgi:hypothetical protein
MRSGRPRILYYGVRNDARTGSQPDAKTSHDSATRDDRPIVTAIQRNVDENPTQGFDKLNRSRRSTTSFPECAAHELLRRLPAEEPAKSTESGVATRARACGKSRIRLAVTRPEKYQNRYDADSRLCSGR